MYSVCIDYFILIMLNSFLKEDNLPLSMQKQRNNMISQIEFNNPNAKTPNYINKDSAKVKSVDNECK